MQNTQYYLRVLHELIEMGADFARQLHRQAVPPAEVLQPQTAAPSPAATQDLSVAFDRIARTIRRTISLAQKLCEPVKTHPAPRFGHTGARKRNLRAVDDSFQPDEEEEVDPAKLTDKELAERIDTLKLELDLDDLDDDFADRPIADIIADICRDLGIADLPDTHPGKRRIIADLALIITSPEAQALRTPPDLPTSEIPTANRAAAIHPHPRNAGRKSTDPPPLR